MAYQGKDAGEAVYHAAVMEEVARMNLFTRMLVADVKGAPAHYRDKHFFRKHGENATYGQGTKK